VDLQFKKLLAPGKIGQILCLGNITDKETFEFLRGIAPDLQIVKGDFDVEAPNLALSKVVTHGSLRIGFTHGHTIIPPGDWDSLLIAARQMDVDVLLWGGTHKFEAYEMEGKFFVNPGSATGAMTTGWWSEEEEPTPSFVLMDVSFLSHSTAPCDQEKGTEYDADKKNRYKETFSCCMCTNCGKTQMAWRQWLWRRSRFGKTAVVYRRARACVFRMQRLACVYARESQCHFWRHHVYLPRQLRLLDAGA
jgi:vacuolar protein sorting-associated protein 29